MNEETDNPKYLEDVLTGWLEEMDKAQSAVNEPIPHRAIAAACLFVEHEIVGIEGDTKENFMTRPWFKKLYTAVYNWYFQKYGSATKQADDPFRGVALFSGVPFNLRIPRTLSGVGEPGELDWLQFPVDVQSGENPLLWIQKPPNFKAMSETERTDLCNQVSEVGTCLRTIRIDLNCAKRPDHESDALANKVIPHLQSAADHILRHTSSGLGLAAWDAHQAVESVLKLLSRQQRGDHRKTHATSRLFEDLGKTSAKEVDLIRELPDAKRIVEMRAGEGNEVGLLEAHGIYMCALRAVWHFAGALNRGKYRVHNASFLLKKAPWGD